MIIPARFPVRTYRATRAFLNTYWPPIVLAVVAVAFLPLILAIPAPPL